MTEKRKISKNDVISNKLLLVLVTSFSGIFVLFYLNRYLTRISTMFFTIEVIKILTYVFAGAAVVFAVASALADSEKYESSTLTPYTLLSFFSILALSCLAITYMYVDAIKLLYIVVPALTVLYLIFHIYQRRFFTSALIIAFSSFTCFAIYKLTDTAAPFRAAAVAIISVLAVLAFTLVLRFVFDKNGGSAKIFGKNIRLLEKGKNTTVYISSAASLLGIIVSVIFGVSAAFYATFALLAYLGALLIVFTIKLM